MIHTEIAIIGGGPAGMCAAIAAAGQGAQVTLLDRGEDLGGQLIKQTHRFFGSEKEYAGTRGIHIINILEEQIKAVPNIDIRTNTTVLAIYDDGIIAFEEEGRYKKLRSQKTIIATGASEKALVFPNNDLPGIYGAGAVQTLMNQYGVIPGDKVLMVGAGNIGLIVSYQLMQAGVKVEAIIDAAPQIGGYLVHASKVARMGVPILTSHTIKEAIGKNQVEGAIVHKINNQWMPIEGTEVHFGVDVICLSVGLSPLVELLRQINCQMKYVPQLGGYVPVRNENMETTVENYYVAGDASGVEEASSAMIEGGIAGLAATKALGYDKKVNELMKHYFEEIQILRSGEVGKKIIEGLKILAS